MNLRPYQTQLFYDIRDAFAQGHRCVLAVSPTGSGKTVTFADITTRTAATGRRICIMAHRAELITQISRALGDLPHGIIAAGRTLHPHRAVQVASVQTLVNRTHRYQFDLLIVDEVHHVVSASYMRVLAAYPTAHVLGVTATPCRLDGRGLADAGYTAMVLGPDVAELTRLGYLCPARVYAPGGIDTSGIKRTAGDFNKAGLSSVADRPVITGNAITHYRRYADRRPAIAFCVSVQHAENVAQGFCEAGYAAASIDGKMQDHQRARLIHALGAGELHVLTSCDLISEGVDVPCVSAGIMLRPTQSKGLWMQQVGRCLRPAPGKDFAVILDHAGNSVRHNMLPDSPQEWSLTAAPVKRGAARDPDVISVTVCAECLLTYATADVCPYCGAARPVVARTVEEVDGELELLDAAYEAAGKKLEERQCKTLQDFEALAQARGYKQGWAWRRWEMSWQKKQAVGA